MIKIWCWLYIYIYIYIYMYINIGFSYLDSFVLLDHRSNHTCFLFYFLLGVRGYSLWVAASMAKGYWTHLPFRTWMLISDFREITQRWWCNCDILVGSEMRQWRKYTIVQRANGNLQTCDVRFQSFLWRLPVWNRLLQFALTEGGSSKSWDAPARPDNVANGCWSAEFVFAQDCRHSTNSGVRCRFSTSHWIVRASTVQNTFAVDVISDPYCARCPLLPFPVRWVEHWLSSHSNLEWLLLRNQCQTFQRQS